MSNTLDPLTFPLRGTQLIEASAGTGKTYTIAALYLRCILGHDEKFGYGRPLIPPEILVVTFTNAATQELRERIRHRLTLAAAFFRGEGDGDDFLIALRNAWPAKKLLAKAWILDQAAQWMDEAAIFTIHGWAQRMLRQHAFDSNSLFDLKLEPNDSELLEEAARDYWRTFLYPLPFDFLRDLLGHVHCKTPLEMLKRVKPLLGSQENDAKDPFAMLEQRSEAIETARRKWESDLDEALDRLRKAKEEKRLNGVIYRSAVFDSWLEQVALWAKKGGPLPDEKVRLGFSTAGLQKGLNKNRSAPAHDAFAAFDGLNEQLAKLEISSAFFAHAANEISNRYEMEKQNRGQMGYDDLLMRLADALFNRQGDSLAHVIRKQFPMALIDEFQDTDMLQYSIFEKIYSGRSDRGFVMIGDPKQSIYAFRGADIHTYLKAGKKNQDNRYTLGRNYRSTVGLVESINRMFNRANRYPQGAFYFKKDISFVPVSSNGLDKRLMVDGQQARSMHWWVLPQTEPVNKTGETGYLHRMAEGFAGEMVRMLSLSPKKAPRAVFLDQDGSSKPITPADCAILVRNRQEAGIIRTSLEKRGLKSVFLSDKDSVYKTAEAQDLLLLLRACASPGRDVLLRAALATSTLCFSVAELDQINEDEAAWDQHAERFGQYRQIWQRRGLLPMLRMLFHDYQVAAGCLSKPTGERTLTHLLHLSELLQSASTHIEGEDALIQWLIDRIHDPGESREEEILRLESDADVVKVITIHKSKGLEFPLVFLPFVCSHRKATKGNTPVAVFHDRHGRSRTVLNPSAEDLAAVDRERMAEDLRLLYVAVTRAKFACWLGIAVTGKKTKAKGEKSELHHSAIGYLVGGGQPIMTSQAEAKLAELRGDCEEILIESLPDGGDRYDAPYREKTSRGTARAFSGQIFSDWFITSYSGMVADAGGKETNQLTPEKKHAVLEAPDSAVEDVLLEENPIDSDSIFSEGAVPSIHSFPRGPQPGILFHELLEWAASCGFATIARDREKIAAHVYRLCRRHAWESWVDVLTDWLQQLLQTSIALPRCNGKLRLEQLQTETYQPELEFLFSARSIDTRMIDKAVATYVFPGKPRPQLKRNLVNGMLKGFIDLAFCHQERYYVLDYKSNHLGRDQSAYNTEALKNAILDHRYDLQYVLYVLALHRQLKARLRCYTYEDHMGGGIYLFLRGLRAEGNGAFVDRPPWPLIDHLDNAFAGQEAIHAR